MKTCIYYDNKDIQVVLTPENNWEKEIVEKMEQKQLTTQLFYGSFSSCNGGYIRQYSSSEDTTSLMILVKDYTRDYTSKDK